MTGVALIEGWCVAAVLIAVCAASLRGRVARPAGYVGATLALMVPFIAGSDAQYGVLASSGLPMWAIEWASLGIFAAGMVATVAVQVPLRRYVRKAGGMRAALRVALLAGTAAAILAGALTIAVRAVAVAEESDALINTAHSAVWAIEGSDASATVSPDLLRAIAPEASAFDGRNLCIVREDASSGQRIKGVVQCGGPSAFILEPDGSGVRSVPVTLAGQPERPVEPPPSEDIETAERCLAAAAERPGAAVPVRDSFGTGLRAVLLPTGCPKLSVLAYAYDEYVGPGPLSGRLAWLALCAAIVCTFGGALLAGGGKARA